MDQLRAFVGHSFSETDTQLVSKILTYLNVIVGAVPGFSWEHAEHPEPRAVDEKVLQMFEGKNVFIGICTRKERVVSDRALRPSWFDKGKLVAAADAFAWKPSDWIIQEVGLAVGRGLKVILLIEEGVRPPGAIQGSLEYLLFNREAPERCFEKLLGMIASLISRATATESASTQTQTDPGQRELEGAADGEDWYSPQEGWQLRHYEIALLHCVFQKDLGAQRRINEHFLASKAGEGAAARLRWRSWWALCRLQEGDQAAFAEVRATSDEAPTDAIVVEQLGMALLEFKEFAAAAFEFERAAGLSTADPASEIRLLGRAAVAYVQAGEPGRASNLEKRLVQVHARTGAGEDEALIALQKTAEQNKEDDLLLGILERRVEVNPADSDLRFALAYKYSQVDQTELSAFHYLRVPETARSALTWNNLGVAFERLSMPIRSIQAYREAEAKGETLAMSNIAIKLLDAGFFDESMSTLETAMAIKDHHRNVDSNLNRAKSALEAEEQKEAEVLAKAAPTSAFYREFGAATARPLPDELSGTWLGPRCELAIALANGRLTATGEYEVKSNGLLGLAMLAKAGHVDRSEPTTTRFSVRYEGRAFGCAVVGRLRVRPEEQGPKTAAKTLLSASEADPMVLMWFRPGADRIAVMERSSPSNVSIYEVRRA